MPPLTPQRTRLSKKQKIKIIEDSCKSKGSGWVFDEAQDDYRCYKMGSGFIGF